MSLTRVVIHEIIKQPQVNGAATFLSETLLPINDSTRRLVVSLNSAFSKDNNSYGNFTVTENSFYDEYIIHKNTPSDEGFLSMTQNITNLLSDSIQNIFLAKGGFFVYCEYSMQRNNFFGVYLVRDVEGVLFNKDSQNHTFQINPVRYLDTNKLAMGARLNIEKLIDGDNNHIALTKSNQSDISEYFIDWIGISRPESNADFTNKLFQIISSIERPINPATDEQYELNEFREVAFEYIKAMPNKVVNLRTLSSTVFGNENSIIDFAEANSFELDHEFTYDPRALNRFKKITANRDGIKLTFSRGDLDRKVTVSEEQNDLVTIKSRSVADAIRQQLTEI